MEKHLSTRELKNDSTEALKSMYESLVRSMMYAFATQLHAMPSFDDLDRDIHSKYLFLQGLFSDTLDKCKTVFDHLGQIILDYLKYENLISESRSPEAFTIVKANAFIDGWTLLEKLHCSKRIGRQQLGSTFCSN